MVGDADENKRQKHGTILDTDVEMFFVTYC